MSRTNGIEPVFTTQPALYGDIIDPETGASIVTRPRCAARSTDVLQWRVLERYNDAMRRVAADRACCHRRGARDAKDRVFITDLMHFTNEGAVRLGDLIADRLEPYLKSAYGTGRPRGEN